MPLTSTESKVMKNMKSQYGDKKGKSVFYASINKGTLKGPGIHEHNKAEKKSELRLTKQAIAIAIMRVLR